MNFSTSVLKTHLVRGISVLFPYQHVCGLKWQIWSSWRQVGVPDTKHFTELSGQDSQFSSSLLSAHSTWPLHRAIPLPYLRNLHWPFLQKKNSLSSGLKLPVPIFGLFFSDEISRRLTSSPLLCLRKATLRLYIDQKRLHWMLTGRPAKCT